MNRYRDFLKADLWAEWKQMETDQRKGLPHPSLQKPYPETAALISLPMPDTFTVGQATLVDLIGQRRSHRRFTRSALSLEELAFLTWATQGVRQVSQDGIKTFRTVPSGGARHPFETYLVVNRVEGLQPGLYRYLALEHKLYLLRADAALIEQLKRGCEEFVAEAAVIFIWTALPYRTEWRYASVAAKLIALDAGHVCQNLYLASEAIYAGTCAIGAYNQQEMDDLVGVDGEDEFVIYAAPVGKVQ
jgi:SagB-type dehydrogenase family enzyme